MSFPRAEPSYSQDNEEETRRQIAEALRDTLKSNQTIQLQPGQQLIVPDEVTGDLYRLKVASGVLSIEAV